MLNDVPNFICFPSASEFKTWNMEQKVQFGAQNFLGTIHLNSESIQQIHRAYLAAELGELAEEPMIEFTIPSLADTTLAPANFFVASIFAQYYPYGK